LAAPGEQGSGTEDSRHLYSICESCCRLGVPIRKYLLDMLSGLAELTLPSAPLSQDGKTDQKWRQSSPWSKAVDGSKFQSANTSAIPCPGSPTLRPNAPPHSPRTPGSPATLLQFFKLAHPVSSTVCLAVCYSAIFLSFQKPWKEWKPIPTFPPPRPLRMDQIPKTNWQNSLGLLTQGHVADSGTYT